MLKLVGVPEAEWFHRAVSSRNQWRADYRVGLEDAIDQEKQQQGVRPQLDPSQEPVRVPCQVCKRSFKSESGYKRHKCLDEREKTCV